LNKDVSQVSQQQLVDCGVVVVGGCVAKVLGYFLLNHRHVVPAKARNLNVGFQNVA